MAFRSSIQIFRENIRHKIHNAVPKTLHPTVKSHWYSTKDITDLTIPPGTPKASDKIPSLDKVGQASDPWSAKEELVPLTLHDKLANMLSDDPLISSVSQSEEKNLDRKTGIILYEAVLPKKHIVSPRSTTWPVNVIKRNYCWPTMPCRDLKPRDCKNCEIEPDPEIRNLRTKLEGCLDCGKKVTPAKGKCFNNGKAKIMLGNYSSYEGRKQPVLQTFRQYCTVSPIYATDKIKCRASCVEFGQDIQKLRNQLEGCCFKEKLRKVECVKPEAQAITKDRLAPVVHYECQIPRIEYRPPVIKPWDSKNCLDLRVQTEGGPCVKTCISSFKLPGCPSRARAHCETGTVYFPCQKSGTPHKAYSECKEEDELDDKHECTYCQMTATPVQTEHGLRDCRKRVDCSKQAVKHCMKTWSNDPCLLFPPSLRKFSTQAREVHSSPVVMEKIDENALTRSTKIDPTLEEKCLSAKCTQLREKDPNVGSEKCPKTPFCPTPENIAKFCKPERVHTWGCDIPMPVDKAACLPLDTKCLDLSKVKSLKDDCGPKNMCKSSGKGSDCKTRKFSTLTIPDRKAFSTICSTRNKHQLYLTRNFGLPGNGMIRKMVSLCNFFRARPNCPDANEYKKSKLLRKAEKAAKAIGMDLVPQSIHTAGYDSQAVAGLSKESPKTDVQKDKKTGGCEKYGLPTEKDSKKGSKDAKDTKAAKPRKKDQKDCKNTCPRMCCPGCKPPSDRDFCPPDERAVPCKTIGAPYASFSESKKFQFSRPVPTECTLQDRRIHAEYMEKAKLNDLPDPEGASVVIPKKKCQEKIKFQPRRDFSSSSNGPIPNILDFRRVGSEKVITIRSIHTTASENIRSTQRWTQRPIKPTNQENEQTTEEEIASSTCAEVKAEECKSTQRDKGPCCPDYCALGKCQHRPLEMCGYCAPLPFTPPCYELVPTCKIDCKLPELPPCEKKKPPKPCPPPPPPAHERNKRCGLPAGPPECLIDRCKRFRECCRDHPPPPKVFPCPPECGIDPCEEVQAKCKAKPRSRQVEVKQKADACKCHKPM